MKIFQRKKAEPEQNPREGIYEAAKQAYRIGVEKQMESSSIMTEKFIDVLCQKLRNPDFRGKLFFNKSEATRTLFLMTIDDDSLQAPSRTSEVETILCGVVEFFESKGFYVSVTRFEKDNTIDEVTISIRKSDMESV